MLLNAHSKVASIVPPLLFCSCANREICSRTRKATRAITTYHDISPETLRVRSTVRQPKCPSVCQPTRPLVHPYIQAQSRARVLPPVRKQTLRPKSLSISKNDLGTTRLIPIENVRARTLVRSIVRTIGRAFDRSLDRSIDIPIARSLDQSLDRSSARCIAASLYRTRVLSFCSNQL